jgi:hypothetical protein
MKSESKNQFAFNLEPLAKLPRGLNERALRLKQVSQPHRARSLNELPDAGGKKVPAAHQAGERALSRGKHWLPNISSNDIFTHA